MLTNKTISYIFFNIANIYTNNYNIMVIRFGSGLKRNYFKIIYLLK